MRSHRFVDPDRHILPLCGTREGLVSALTIAIARTGADRPAVLMPNPFYQAYYAAALTSRIEPVLLAASAGTGFLPDLDALDPVLLDRTAAFYLASPANPQGAVASEAYLERLIGLAHRHGFYVFSDECYSEIYQEAPPPGILQAAARMGGFERVLAFNSLSKRSNAPGLRSGFIAGDEGFSRRLYEVPERSLAAGAAARAICLGGALGGRGACGAEPRALSREVRRLVPKAWHNAGILSATRRLLLVAGSFKIRWW